jgi:hypothetical protein
VFSHFLFEKIINNYSNLFEILKIVFYNYFTNAGDFHQGKGNKKSRLGPKTILRGGKKLTPNEIAINKLTTILQKRNLLSDNIYRYINLLRNSDQIRFMNMNVLAEVVNYVSTDPDISEISYASIYDRLELLILEEKEEKDTEEDLNIVKLRLVATFFRYLKYILFTESKNTE